MKSNIEELRKKYINNPPEGLTSMDIRNMSEDELLAFLFLLYRKVRLWLLSKRKIAHIKVGRANR